MKTKILIEQLQREDPSGEKEVVCSTPDGNIDIHFVETKAGYWDGPYQLLKIIPNSNQIIGAEYRNDGVKICLCLQSIDAVLLDDPNLPIDVIDAGDGKELKQHVEEWRKEALEANVEMMKFLQKDRIERGM